MKVAPSPCNLSAPPPCQLIVSGLRPPCHLIVPSFQKKTLIIRVPGNLRLSSMRWQGGGAELAGAPAERLPPAIFQSPPAMSSFPGGSRRNKSIPQLRARGVDAAVDTRHLQLPPHPSSHQLPCRRPLLPVAAVHHRPAARRPYMIWRVSLQASVGNNYRKEN